MRFLPTHLAAAQAISRAISTLPETARLFFIRVPKLSPTMESGSVKAWHKKEGEQVEEESILLDLSSDSLVEEENKVTEEFSGEVDMEIEVHEDGYLAAILQQPDSKRLRIGDPLAILCEEKEHVGEVQKMVGEGKLKELEKKCVRDAAWQAYRKAMTA